MTGIEKLKILIETTFDDYPDTSLQAHIKEAVADFDELKELTAALWENKHDDDWCFEMSSTIEEVIQK